LRYFLTILAILIIMLLSAALAVPYFVNWNDQRELVAARISQFLGADVRINGPIDLKLLPTPYLMLGSVEIADPAGKSAASLEEIRLEIALTPLLHGDIDFVEAQLVHPKLRLDLIDDTIDLRLPQLKGDLRFDRLSVTNGEITIHDPAVKRSLVFTGLDLTAEAPSLDGPYKGDGEVAHGDGKIAFHFSTAAADNNQLRFKLLADETASHGHLDLDGNLSFDPRGPAAALPALDGQLVLTGRTDSPITLPWRLNGALHGELRKAALTDFTLRIGDDDHGIDIPGSADFDLGTTPGARLSLKAKQVNLDRLLTDKEAPPAPQSFEALVRNAIGSEQKPPFPITLEWNFDTLTLGNETFGGVSGTLGLAQASSTPLKIAGEGPGRSRLLLDGKIEPGSAPTFDGHVEASTGDFTRIKDWLATNLPDLGANRIPLQVRSFAIVGKANISTVGFFGSDLRLRFDRSTLAGSVAYTRNVGSDPPRFYADLSAPSLDLDRLPDIRPAFDPANPIDLSLRLDSHAVKVADVGQGPIDAGRIVLKLTKTGPRATLEKLDIIDLGGMNLDASGNFDGKSGQIEAKLDAAGLTDAATLLHRLFPGPISEAFAARATSLAPAHFNLQAEIQYAEADRFALSALSLEGAAAKTNIVAKLIPDARDHSHVTISVRLDAPETAALFRQIGFAALPFKGLGAGKIELSAQGAFDKPLATQLSATLAGSKFDFHGTLDPNLAVPRATGTLKLASNDLSGLLETTAITVPDLAASRIPADISGEVEWKNGNLHLSKSSGSLAAIPIAGDLTYAGATKRLSGSIDLASMSLANVFDLALGPPQGAKPGQNWSELAFMGGLVNPPTANLAIRVKNFAVWPGINGTDAKLNFDIGSDHAGLKIGLRLTSMQVGAGSIQGNLALRRDSASASLEGHLMVQDYAFALPSAAGNLSASFDFASTGNNAAALVGGLAGGGVLRFSDLGMPRADPQALLRVFKAIEEDRVGMDEGEIERALTREFDKKPLTLRNAEFEGGLAAGILRLTPKAGAKQENPSTDQAITTSLQANIDFRNLSLDQRTLLTLDNLPKNWKAAPPQVALVSKGPLLTPSREIEAAAFINALAARAITRESARIEEQEFDLHERSFFYQRLLSERRREQEREKVEDQSKHAAEVAAGAAEANPEDHKADVPLPPINYELRHVPQPVRRPPALRVPNIATDPVPQLPLELHSPALKPGN
jgi:hypothetical protein